MSHDRNAAAHARDQALDDLDLLASALDGVGDLLSPDAELGFRARSNIACLFMVLHERIQHSIETVRKGETQ